MSTRRTTRATSRQASSRGASPAISTADIPATPRRTTRRAGASNATPLPAVGIRQSTAYGTNTIAQPARGSGPQASDQINNVLDNLLQPERDDSSTVGGRGRVHTPRRGGRSTPAPSDRSFNHESAIFGNAGIESSSIIEDPGDLSGIPELPESDDLSEPYPPSIDTLNANAQRQHFELMARERVDAARAASGQSFSNFVASAKTVSGYLWSWLKSSFSSFPTALAALLSIGFGISVLAMIILSLLPGTQIRSYGYDIKSNIGQFIPYRLSHPLDSLNPSDIQSINRRLNDLEYKVSQISSQPSDLDSKSLKRIQDLLPDFLVVKKDKYGNNVIPDDFWHALQDKIRSDDTILHDRVQQTGKQSSRTDGDLIALRDLERETRKVWDKYIKANQAKIEKFNDDELVNKFPQLLEKNQIAPKQEVIELIRQNWEDNRKEVRSELSQLTKKLDNTSRQIAKLQHDFRDDAKAIAEDVVRKFIPNAQLGALAGANLRSNVDYGLTRLNHFSKGTGAVVDPYLTSPKHIFPSMDVWFPKRVMRWAMGNAIPSPNSPDAALQKWEEHGDCWCSPARDAEGYGPSLGVIMGSNIYPDQVVVEHITPTAALEPGAAPREMELLAYIPDHDTYNAVRTMSDDIFRDETEGESQHPFGFARVATWTYDIESSQNVQAFAVQLDMKALGAHTNKLIIRSKNNWGGDKVDYTCLYRIRVHGDVVATPGLY